MTHLIELNINIKVILAQSFHDILDIGPGANSEGRQSDHGVCGSSLPGAEMAFQTNKLPNAIEVGALWFRTPSFRLVCTIVSLLFDYRGVLTLNHCFANT